MDIVKNFTNNMKNKLLQVFGFGVWIVTSILIGAVLLNGVFTDPKGKFPSGYLYTETPLTTPIIVGILEIISPLWMPVWLLGQLIINLPI